MIKRAYDEMLMFIATVAAIFVAASVLVAILIKYIAVIATVVFIVAGLFVAYRVVRRFYRRRSF